MSCLSQPNVKFQGLWLILPYNTTGRWKLSSLFCGWELSSFPKVTEKVWDRSSIQASWTLLNGLLSHLHAFPWRKDTLCQSVFKKTCFAFNVYLSLCCVSCSRLVQAASQQATKTVPKTALYSTKKAAINLLDASLKLVSELYLLEFHAQSLL